MAVEVVGDLAHDPVVGPAPGPEDLVGHPAELGAHVIEVGLGGLGAVVTPDHHGDVAYFAVGDPADVVLVVPGGEAGGLTELAPRGR